MTVITPPRKRTLYDKIWDDHVIHTDVGDLALIYIDRHLVHEVSSPQAFDGLKAAGRVVRRPDCTLATVDHNVPTLNRKGFTSIDSYVSEPNSRAQCNVLEENVRTFNLRYFGMKDRRQGIVHVIGPEQGFTLPGITCVCGDSHSSTHGAFGSLAFGIGTSEVEHVLATQTLLQKKSKNMRIAVDGDLNDGVTSKDVILHIIGAIGTAGGTGCVIEYTGSVIRSFSMEARMSICNMSIEAGARAGMVAPDDVTFNYLKGRPLAPRGDEWNAAVEYWRTLRSDDGAHYDIDVNIAAADIVPTVTWGTSPQDIVPVTGSVPDPSSISDPSERASAIRALEYMGLEPNTPMQEIKLDKVFIGSCTNSRIEDLRAAAKVIIAAGPDAAVPPGIQALVVPGSGLVKQHAEAEGLDTVFTRAGFEWREAGCSMCIGMNADMLKPGERCASTSNRNFRGRQGPGGRTHLMSPAMAAAAALTGKITDVRQFTGRIKGDENGSNVSLEIKNIRDLGLLQDPEEIIRSAPSFDSHSDSSPLTTPQPAMEKFTILKGIAAPIHIDNIDTDVIIPVPFCKTLKRTGLAEGLFYPLRKDPATGASTNFILNVPPYDRARIIVCTGVNFGCGSSREHASWSLKDFGILCVIAPSFGEIFRNNAMQNGMLPISIPQEQCRILAEDAAAGLDLEVDLEREEIRRANGPSISFTIDPFRRHCLLNGLDDISLTLEKELSISEFEKRRTQTWPWLDGVGFQGKIVPVTSAKGTGKMEW